MRDQRVGKRLHGSAAGLAAIAAGVLVTAAPVAAQEYLEDHYETVYPFYDTDTEWWQPGDWGDAGVDNSGVLGDPEWTEMGDDDWEDYGDSYDADTYDDFGGYTYDYYDDDWYDYDSGINDYTGYDDDGVPPGGFEYESVEEQDYGWYDDYDVPPGGLDYDGVEGDWEYDYETTDWVDEDDYDWYEDNEADSDDDKGDYYYGDDQFDNEPDQDRVEEYWQDDD